jgi:hypothetical protein
MVIIMLSSQKDDILLVNDLMGGWCNFSLNTQFSLLYSSLTLYFKQFIRPSYLYIVTRQY